MRDTKMTSVAAVNLKLYVSSLIFFN